MSIFEELINKKDDKTYVSVLNSDPKRPSHLTAPRSTNPAYRRAVTFHFNDQIKDEFVYDQQSECQKMNYNLNRYTQRRLIFRFAPEMLMSFMVTSLMAYLIFYVEKHDCFGSSEFDDAFGSMSNLTDMYPNFNSTTVINA